MSIFIFMNQKFSISFPCSQWSLHMQKILPSSIHHKLPVGSAKQGPWTRLYIEDTFQEQ